MKDAIFYIVAAGEKMKLDFVPARNDFVVAVDGGYNYLLNENIRIDLVIGDMDSIGCMPVHKNVIKLAKEKDDTDTLAAIKIGIKEGYKNFHIYCATGGERFSHTVANIQCLEYIAKRGGHGYLFAGSQTITVICNDEIILPKKENTFVSIFSLAETTIVTLEGLKYSGKDIKFSSDYPIGISNEFRAELARIKAENGSLLIVYDEK